MSRRKIIGLSFLLLLISILAIGCSGAKSKSGENKDVGVVVKNVSGDKAWQYDIQIKEKLKATCGDKEATIGDLDTHKVQVFVPGKSFNKSTKVTMANPKEVPKVVSKEFTPMGAPIEVAVNSKSTRLNQPVQVTMKIDKEKLDKGTDAGSLWAVYYDGGQWEYVRPSKVDLEAGTLTFTTYHFSLFGYGKISVEERIEKYTHSKALEEMVQDEIDDKVDEIAEKAIEHLLKDRLGIDDESTKFKVYKSLLNDDDYKDLYDKFKEGDVLGFNKTLQVFIGGKIAENVEESTLSKALGALADDKGVEYTEAASEAAGYLAEGRYKDAARILGEKIADEFMITKLTKAAAEVIDYEIGVWKNDEVEAAYNAYKDGADGYFWGYNVDPGDFDGVWDQMRGIGRQLEMEAIRIQNEIREEGGQPPLTEKEMDKIRSKVKADLKKQFEQRKKEEDELEKEEKKLKDLIDALDKAKLLEEGMFNYNGNYDTMETRLDKLFHLRDKILRDTGRKGWHMGAFSNKKDISIGDLITLSQAWLSGENGRQQYAKLLKDKFGIDLFPKPKELTGIWSTGSFTITNMPAMDAPKSGKGEGCDIDWSKLKDKPMPMSLDIKMNAGGTGTLTTTITFLGKKSKGNAIPLKYAYGQVTAQGSQNGATMRFTGQVDKTDTGYTINGTWSGSSKDGSFGGTWSASKPK